MTLNNNRIDQTQISSSNFVIIHNQRKKKERSPKKQNKKAQTYVPCTSEWLAPWNYEALQKLWKTCIDLLNHVRTKKKKKSKIRKGEWEKDKKKNGRIWWRTKGNHEGESSEDQALTSQVVLLIKVFNSASVRKWRHRGRYKGSDTWDWRGNIILDAKNSEIKSGSAGKRTKIFCYSCGMNQCAGSLN